MMLCTVCKKEMKIKSKDKKGIADYIMRLEKAIAHIRLQVLATEMYGNGYIDSVENLDELEQKKKYIDKLLKNTSAFARYYEGRKGKTANFPSNKDIRAIEKSSDMVEEIFYLVYHIQHYEKREKDERK